MKVNLSCKEVSHLLSTGQDEQLPGADRARLRLHFVMCEGCRNVQSQLDFLRRAMQRMSRGDEPPDDSPPAGR
jgi:hypothetical protein